MQTEGRTVQATYDFAIDTTDLIGPSCAVADFKGGKLVVWTASQATICCAATGDDVAVAQIASCIASKLRLYACNGHTTVRRSGVDR